MSNGIKEGYLTSWNSILLKLFSNLVQMKFWLSAAGFYAMLISVLNPYVWVGLVSLVYGLGKLTKIQYLRSVSNGVNTEGNEEPSSE